MLTREQWGSEPNGPHVSLGFFSHYGSIRIDLYGETNSGIVIASTEIYAQRPEGTTRGKGLETFTQARRIITGLSHIMGRKIVHILSHTKFKFDMHTIHSA